MVQMIERESRLLYGTDDREGEQTALISAVVQMTERENRLL